MVNEILADLDSLTQKICERWFKCHHKSIEAIETSIYDLLLTKIKNSRVGDLIHMPLVQMCNQVAK